MTIIKMNRLIADDGKILVNGNQTATVVDCFVTDTDKWSEIDAPDEK